MRQYDKPMTELNPSVVKEAKSESHFICNKICLIFFLNSILKMFNIIVHMFLFLCLLAL